MSKRFVFSTAPAASEVEAGFIRFFEERGIKWWHWMPGMWLLISSDLETASSIRDALRNDPRFGENRELLILQVQGEPGQWAGASHPRGTALMGEWLDNVWDKPPF